MKSNQWIHLRLTSEKQRRGRSLCDLTFRETPLASLHDSLFAVPNHHLTRWFHRPFLSGFVEEPRRARSRAVHSYAAPPIRRLQLRPVRPAGAPVFVDRPGKCRNQMLNIQYTAPGLMLVLLPLLSRRVQIVGESLSTLTYPETNFRRRFFIFGPELSTMRAVPRSNGEGDICPLSLMIPSVLASPRRRFNFSNDRRLARNQCSILLDAPTYE